MKNCHIFTRKKTCFFLIGLNLSSRAFRIRQRHTTLRDLSNALLFSKIGQFLQNLDPPPDGSFHPCTCMYRCQVWTLRTTYQREHHHLMSKQEPQTPPSSGHVRRKRKKEEEINLDLSRLDSQEESEILFLPLSSSFKTRFFQNLDLLIMCHPLARLLEMQHFTH